MKRFLSIILMLTLLAAPIVSLNCSAMGNNEGPYGRAQVVIGDESGSGYCSKPKSESFLGSVWRWTCKTIISAVSFGVVMFVLDSCSPKFEWEKNLGTKAGAFLKNFKESYPGISGFPGEAWSKISASGAWGTLQTVIGSVLLTTKNHFEAFTNAFQTGFINGTIPIPPAKAQ